MTTDAFAQVLFNTGEEVVADDLSGVGRRTLASLWDQLVYASLPREAFVSDLDSAFDPTTSPYAFALTISGARPIQGSANNKVKIARGTLMQAVAAIDGAEPKLIPFTFDGTTEVTIANGGANPRVDIVQMALSYVEDTSVVRNFKDAVTGVVTASATNTRRRVQCILSVKQGAEAASPTYPTPDSGNVVIAGVVVNASYAGAAGLLIQDTAGAVAVLHDQRMPMRVRPHWSGPPVWSYSLTYFIGFDASGDMYVQRNAVDPGGSHDMLMPCPVIGNHGRLVELDCNFQSGTSTLVSMIATYNSAATTTRLAHANMDGGTSGESLRRSNPLSFQALHIAAAGPTIVAAANGMGPPIWSNGCRAPGNQNTGQHNPSFPIVITPLALLYVNPPTPVYWTRAGWYFAEGM